MSTDSNLILTESVKYSLCSDVIITFLLTNYNNAVFWRRWIFNPILQKKTRHL